MQAHVHIDKPGVFTGSWMEEIRSIEDLMAHIDTSTSKSELVLKIFNVLVPYNKELP